MGPFINVSGRAARLAAATKLPCFIIHSGHSQQDGKRIHFFLTVLNVGVFFYYFFCGVFATAIDAWVATVLSALVTAVGAAHMAVPVCVCVCVGGGGGGDIKYTVDREIFT